MEHLTLSVRWMKTLQDCIVENRMPIQSQSSQDLDILWPSVEYLWFGNLSWYQRSAWALFVQYMSAKVLRALIPIWNLIINKLTQLDIPLTNKPKILCHKFEDNQGAYLLARNQQLLVSTKFFCVKYHFFWQFVYHPECNHDGWLMVEKCNTELMNADYRTKGFVRSKFEGNRSEYNLVGWLVEFYF